VLVVLVMGDLMPFSRANLTVTHVCAALAALAGVAGGFVVAAVAARARGQTSGIAKAITLGVAAWVVVCLVEMLLADHAVVSSLVRAAHVPSTTACKTGRRDALSQASLRESSVWAAALMENLKGAIIAGGLFGLIPVPLVVYYWRLQAAGDGLLAALDVAPRVLIGAAGSLLPLSVLLVAVTALVSGLGFAAGVAVFASVVTALSAWFLQRGRLLFLHRVRAGAEPHYRIEKEVDGAAEGLPSFVGSGEGACGVLLYAPADAAGHPFRADRRGVPVARVHLDRAAAAVGGMTALARAGRDGTATGLGVLLGAIVVLLALRQVE
jgi:hypothetical protein